MTKIDVASKVQLTHIGMSIVHTVAPKMGRAMLLKKTEFCNLSKTKPNNAQSWLKVTEISLNEGLHFLNLLTLFLMIRLRSDIIKHQFN